MKSGASHGTEIGQLEAHAPVSSRFETAFDIRSVPREEHGLAEVDNRPCSNIKVGRHGRCAVADVGHADIRLMSKVVHAVWIGVAIECIVVRRARERVAGIAAVYVTIQVTQSVRLLEVHLVVILVCIPRLTVVDMEDEEPGIEKINVGFHLLAVFYEEVLAPGSSIRPEFVNFGVVLLIPYGLPFEIGRDHHRGDPSELLLAPRAHVGRIICMRSVSAPRPRCHEAPLSESLRGIVGVIEIRKTEDMSEFMRKDADLDELPAGVLVPLHLRLDGVIAVNENRLAIGGQIIRDVPSLRCNAVDIKIRIGAGRFPCEKFSPDVPTMRPDVVGSRGRVGTGMDNAELRNVPATLAVGVLDVL